MAAPRFSPVPPTDRSRYYESPDHVPDSWSPDRPGDIEGFQPEGPRLGEQGPDQGFALHIAAQLRPKLQMQPGEHADDAIRGCLGVALRRGSMFSRAPVVHDLTIAFTIWGFYDPAPPAESGRAAAHDVRRAPPHRPSLHGGASGRRLAARCHAADDAGAGRSGVSDRLAHPRRRLIEQRAS